MARRVTHFGFFVMAACVLGALDTASHATEQKEFAAPLGGDKAEVDRVLIQAFGAECAELSRPIRLSLHAKGPVIATRKIEIEKDGRVRLVDFSAALFHKS